MSPTVLADQLFASPKYFTNPLIKRQSHAAYADQLLFRGKKATGEELYKFDPKKFPYFTKILAEVLDKPWNYKEQIAKDLNLDIKLSSREFVAPMVERLATTKLQRTFIEAVLPAFEYRIKIFLLVEKPRTERHDFYHYDARVIASGFIQMFLAMNQYYDSDRGIIPDELSPLVAMGHLTQDQADAFKHDMTGTFKSKLPVIKVLNVVKLANFLGEIFLPKKFNPDNFPRFLEAITEYFDLHPLLKTRVAESLGIDHTESSRNIWMKMVERLSSTPLQRTLVAKCFIPMMDKFNRDLRFVDKDSVGIQKQYMSRRFVELFSEMNKGYDGTKIPDNFIPGIQNGTFTIDKAQQYAKKFKKAVFIYVVPIMEMGGILPTLRGQKISIVQDIDNFSKALLGIGLWTD